MQSNFSPRDLLPHPERSALLVIDVQERLAPAMPADRLPEVLRNTRILIETAREFSLPVLVSEQYPKGLGPTVAQLRDVLPESCTPVAKTAFSCCGEPAFGPILDAITGRDIILCGMETHVCVLQTALDLLEQGRRVYVAADAVASRTALNWQTGLDLMHQAGAVIGTTEVFAFGLLRAAGTEQFKRISRMVK
jgi:nicotinamidase-related amidase